jgi:hypothetical protein
MPEVQVLPGVTAEDGAVRFSVQFGPADDVSVGADDVFVLVPLREATRKRLPPQMFDTVRIAFAGHCFESMYDIGRPQEATPCGCPHFLHWGRHGGLPLPKIWRTESNRGGVMDHGPSAVFALVAIVSNRCTMLGEPNNRVRGTGCLGPPPSETVRAGHPHTALRSMVHLQEDRQFRTCAVAKEYHPRSMKRACAALYPFLHQGCQHALAPLRSFHAGP